MDERGVKHKDEDTPLDTHGTLYRVTTTADWVYEEPPSCDLLVRSRYDIGAEDAIEVEATLGRGTCHDEGDPSDFCCSACGVRMFTDTSDTYTMIASDGRTIIKHPNYCPNCGARVIGEDA